MRARTCVCVSTSRHVYAYVYLQSTGCFRIFCSNIDYILLGMYRARQRLESKTCFRISKPRLIITALTGCNLNNNYFKREFLLLTYCDEKWIFKSAIFHARHTIFVTVRYWRNALRTTTVY